eukprot:GHVL01023753.1.p1 GENE.GHVL01023753.1~~GHVL01023753.1.p1  ORF type:complete len:549 (+),score=64.34 GHVL01023753.1:382-2028(+)
MSFPQSVNCVLNYSCLAQDCCWTVSGTFELPTVGVNKHSKCERLYLESSSRYLPCPGEEVFCLKTKSAGKCHLVSQWQLEETELGNNFFEMVREMQLTHGCWRPFDVSTETKPIPFGIRRVIRNPGWKVRLRKGHKSLLIRVVNFTRVAMTRIVETFPLGLKVGNWIEFPSELIPAFGGCAEFGVRSGDPFGGTQGCLMYDIGGCGLVVNWKQPGLGSLSVTVDVNGGNRYSAVTHHDEINENTLACHITEPSRPPPPIKVLSCIAFPPSQRSTRDNKGIDITQQLHTIFCDAPAILTRTMSSDTNRPNHPDSVIRIASLKGLASDKNLSKIVMPKSKWQIQWMIGPEIMKRTFAWEEPVKIDSRLTCGTDDLHTILSAHAEISGESVPPEMLLDDPTGSSPTTETLVETVHSAICIFCESMNWWIREHMPKIGGDKWRDKVLLPKGCIWAGNDGGSQFDLDGILNILEYCYNSEKKIKPDNLEKIKKLEHYWRTQETTKFTESYIKSVIQEIIKMMTTMDLRRTVTVLQEMLSLPQLNWKPSTVEQF